MPLGTVSRSWSGRPLSTLRCLLLAAALAVVAASAAAPAAARVCADQCQSDADFKEEVLADTPGLADQLASDDTWAAAVNILRWASPRTAFASVGDMLVETAGETAAELYRDYFQTGRRGVYCGGAADFLVKALKLFGVPAFRLDYGNPAFFTHAIVVVPLESSGGDVEYRMLDPTFNAYYVVAWSGRPASVQEVLESWRAGRMDLIAVREASLGERLIVRDTDADGIGEPLSCADGAESTGCGLAAFEPVWTPVVEPYGYTADVAGLTKLLGLSTIFYPDWTSVPDDFLRMHSTFKAAVLAGDNSVHIADLPLPPAPTHPPVPPAPADPPAPPAPIDQPRPPAPAVEALPSSAERTASSIPPPSASHEGDASPAETVVAQVRVRRGVLRFVFESDRARKVTVRVALHRERWRIVQRRTVSLPSGRGARRVRLHPSSRGRRLRIDFLVDGTRIARMRAKAGS